MNRISDWKNGKCVIFVACLLTVVHISSVMPVAAGNPTQQQLLVDRAAYTLKNFIYDSNMKWFRDNLKNAKGLFIVPRLIKAGLLWGGSGGNGVFLVKDPQTGQWSQPGFYGMGSISFGLQIGGEVAEVVILVMTHKGKESLYTDQLKLGGSASVAAGPVGIGTEGATPMTMSADMVSFMRAKGAYAGASLEGALIKTSGNWNKAYYGKTVRPVDIFEKNRVSNPHSVKLLNALNKFGR